MPLVEVVLRRWVWLVVSGIVLGGSAFLAGRALWTESYTATAQLIRYEPPTSVEIFGYRQISPETFVSLIRSPELLERVSAKASAPISPAALAANLSVMPERNSEIMLLTMTGTNPQTVLELVNRYAEEVVRFTQEMQAKAAGEANEYLKQQLASVEADITAFNQQRQLSTKPSLQTEVPPDAETLLQSAAQTRLAEKLRAAREELFDLLTRYTEIHPLVQAQRAKLAIIEKQIAEASSLSPSVAGANGKQPSPATRPEETSKGTQAKAAGPSKSEPDVEIVRSKLQALENNRLLLLGRHRAAQSFQDNPGGYFRVFASAAPKDVVMHGNRLKVAFLSCFSGLIGILGSIAVILLLEFVDGRIKTAADVKRITRLPILATLDDLQQLDMAAQKNWAFRTWTAIQGRLSPSPHHGLVCGITSSAHGEGRSTWVALLAEAAMQRGFRVLTIATRPSSAPMDSEPEVAAQTHDENLEKPNGAALSTNILASPVEVTQRLVGPEPQPRVHIPLPGWVWDLERRKQWQAALNHWRKIDNIVILVELPPASMPEAVLLAESLPNLIWLADSGKSDSAETRAQLETLRYARCKLVGAVVNHDTRPMLRNRFPRWLACSWLLWAATFANGQAVATNLAAVQSAPPATTNLSFSALSAGKRAAWQERLTLGPGDVLNFGLYGQPELSRAEVSIGPDGRVGFLEAQDIMAAGLTIDELRAKFDEALVKYRRAPRTVITPVAFKSKKYFMLGKVAQQGVYTLDWPLTIIEAVARARGLAIGLADGNSIDLADFQRSFVARGGKRISINFEKLFQDGDLSQNIPIEPGDYICFLPAHGKEVYVLGEVRLAGPVTYTADISVIAAISSRAGFTERAYKSRVLVVRGSLNHPETFVVDTMAILDARAPDFKLQPKDIIYVSSRPFIKVEELLDLATTAFIQAAMTGWVGQDVIEP